MRAVWAVFVPPPASELAVGRRHARARRRTRARGRRRSAGRCGRSARRARSRSSRDTAAALTNWGRLPTTVTIRMAGKLDRRRSRRRGKNRGRCGEGHVVWYVSHQDRQALALAGRQLLLDSRAQGLPGVSRVRSPSGSSKSSIPAIDCASRRVDARKASLASRRSSMVQGRSVTSATFITRSRVIEARMCSLERRRVDRAGRVDPEERRGGGLEHAPVRGHEQSLVKAALAREPAAQHVGAIRERLDAVEHPCGRVFDHTEAHPLGRGWQRFREQEAATAASKHDAQRAVEVAAAALLQERWDLALQLASRHIVEPKVRRRTFQAIEVVGHRKRSPVVHADHLKRPITAQKPLVGGRDGRLLGGHRPAIHACELSGGRGSGYLVGHGGLSWQAAGDGAQVPDHPLGVMRQHP